MLLTTKKTPIRLQQPLLPLQHQFATQSPQRSSKSFWSGTHTLLSQPLSLALLQPFFPASAWPQSPSSTHKALPLHTKWPSEHAQAWIYLCQLVLPKPNSKMLNRIFYTTISTRLVTKENCTIPVTCKLSNLSTEDAFIQTTSSRRLVRLS